MSWDDTENYRMGGSYKWPSLADVLEYRRQVKEVVIDVIENAPLEFPITPQSPWWSLFMGMEHERIHLETSSVLIRQLPIDHVQKPTNWIYAPPKISDAAVRNEMITVPEGTVRFGKPVDFPSYGWDNEYGQVEMNAPEFEASKYLVTNREFFEFVNAGGYKNKQYWTDEGWKWVTYCGANHPTFWVCQEGCKSRCGAALSSYSHCLPRVVENGHANGSMNGETNTTKYRYRTVYDVIDMPWDWPVDINYHEAKAFCKWKGPDYRLPTEAEHHRMRGDPDPSTDILCDPVFRKDTNINLQFKYGSSNPVNMFPATPLGFHDIYGNVWEWVEDHFNGLPGFEATYLYNDFSTPCFDGRHTLMMGGSWASTGSSEASRFSRYAFRRHFFQHAGFRVVKSANPAPVRLCGCEVYVLGVGVEDNPVQLPICDKEKCWLPSTNGQFQYEVESNLVNLLDEEYGGGIQKTNSQIAYYESVVQKYNCKTSSALHIGCGAGYTSLMLSKTFESVVGIDYCGRYINSAMQIQKDGRLKFGSGKEAKIPDTIDAKKVTFIQLTWLPNEIENHDFVLVEFLDRVISPTSWLVKLWECITTDGLLVLSTSSKWTIDSLTREIGKWFKMVENTAQRDKMITVWKMKN
ncbi:hercynine oxygenase-like isoform X2 [Dysidea avara]